ncbi:hypothetical protein PHMEG_00019779 [Phytophthora megakarya]|uniref:Uncharacterized protein n=1 Tax=Phytophthora megakarya TaxID=4795 RepID=A0A225VS04_9STRA|nr:hypothetical protein PHMEG_00019779 [Phytophthora megakarya]
MTADQLGHVLRQQDRLPAQTSEHLQAPHDRPSALLAQQQEVKRQMDEHRQYLEELYRLLRTAEEAVGLTLVRISGFELFKDEKDLTEAEWRDYFLSARLPDNTAYKTLEREVKNLSMNLELEDAESRLSRLMVNFYEIVNKPNMEDVVQAETKKVI